MARATQIIAAVSGRIQTGDEDLPVQAEATDYYDRLVVKGVTMSDADFIKVNSVVYYLKNTLGVDGLTSLWDSLDAMRIPGRTELEMRENLIKNSHHATITNNYGGSYTALEGYIGNGTNFSVNTGVNLSTTVKASQNSVALGILVLDDKSGNDAHEVGALKTGASDGLYMYTKRSSANSYDGTGSINGAYTGSAVSRTMISSRAWYGLRRAASTDIVFSVNGYYSAGITGTSSSPANLNVIEFAASVNGTISSWSALRHGCFYVGNSNIDHNKIIEILTKYYFIPHANANSTISNRLIGIGDSMTGDETAANTGLSVLSEYVRRSQTQLGNTWTSVQNGDANRQVILSPTVPSLNSIFATQVTSCGPNTAFTKDVIILNIGTNDIGLNAVSNSDDLEAAIDARIAELVAQDKIVIVFGIGARGVFGGGQTLTNFNLARADYRTHMLATYTVASGVTNVWRNAGSTVFFCDVQADSRFGNSANSTYFQVDAVHYNSTLYDIMADEYIVPICQL